MAIKQGWDGAILIGSDELANMNSWTINFAADALENTDFGDADRTYQPGLRNVTIDFAGSYESSDTAAYALVDNFISTNTNTAVTVVCLVNNTTGTKSGWTGIGPITALTVGGAVDSLVPLSGSIQVSGGMSTYAT